VRSASATVKLCSSSSEPARAWLAPTGAAGRPSGVRPTSSGRFRSSQALGPTASSRVAMPRSRKTMRQLVALMSTCARGTMKVLESEKAVPNRPMARPR
jgi:hypothetical protein